MQTTDREAKVVHRDEELLRPTKRAQGTAGEAAQNGSPQGIGQDSAIFALRPPACSLRTLALANLEATAL